MAVTNPPFPSLLSPFEVARHARLPPNRGGPTHRVERRRETAADGNELFAERDEILQDNPVLDDDVRLRDLVVRTAVVPVDGPRIDTGVDAEQGHPNFPVVIVCQCPEAAVRVAVLWADAGMQDERAVRGDREDRPPEESLAEGKQ